MKKLLYCLASSLFLLAGCSNESIDVNKGIKKNYITSINATMDDLAETRAQLLGSGGDVDVVWHRNERISVFSDEQDITQYELKTGEGTTIGSFTGEVVNGNTFYALSITPQSYDVNSEGDIVLDRENNAIFFDYVCSGMTNREFDSDGYYRIPMLAKSSDNNMSFKQLTGIIHFSITGTHKISSMNLITPEKNISGRAKINLNTEEPIMEMTGEPTAEIMSFGLLSTAASFGGIQLKPDEPIDVYFMVPPGEYHGLILDMRTDSELPVIRSTDKSFTVGRGVVKHFTAMDTNGYLDEVWKPTYDKLMAFYNATGGENWTRNDNWGSDLPFDEWYGIEGGPGYYDVQAIELSNNNLSGVFPEELTELPMLGYINISNNNIEGSLPVSLANMNNLWHLNVSGNKMNGVISKTIQDSDMWRSLEISYSNQQAGYSLVLSDYISTDFTNDGNYSMLLTHKKGNGIPLVIMGDAFSDRLFNDGTYENAMQNVCNNFFSIEPYTSFKDYFDVYMVNAISKEEQIGGETAFNVGVVGDMYKINNQNVRNYVNKIPIFNGNLQNVTSIVVINDKSQVRENAQLFSDGFANAMTNLYDDGYLTHHEAGGHAFGKLGDEYSNDDKTGERQFSNAYNPDFLTCQNMGWYLNLSSYNDPETVYWADFIKNHDYEIEKIGMYEGGYGSYSKGIWRPTFNSVMNGSGLVRDVDDFDFYLEYSWSFYNAPSRWIIYQRIMNLAGEAYTFDDFLEYDKVNLQKIAELRASTRSIGILKNQKRKVGATPIIYDYPSSEIGMH